MSLLEQGLNSAIRNFEWSTKVGGVSDADGYRGLNASSAKLNIALVGTPEWNATTLKSRHRYLVEAGLKVFAKDWVKTGKVTVSPFKP